MDSNVKQEDGCSTVYHKGQQATIFSYNFHLDVCMRFEESEFSNKVNFVLCTKNYIQ